MGMLDKISRIVIGSERATARDAVTVLTDTYTAAMQRSRDLAQHAELAPQPASADALRELAAAEEAQAARLREALRTAGVDTRATPEAPVSGGSNHWARLVADLEAHRASMRGARERAVHFAETVPSTAALFDQLSREEALHCERLRALIARADPQALD